MAKRNPLQVLLLDDDRHLVQLYADELARQGALKVTIATDGVRARNLAMRQLFDIIVTDAKLPYRGEQYGGLQLADDLRPRYGKHSIVVISQFIKAGELRAHEADYEFVDKENGGDLRSFISHLVNLFNRLKSQQYVFVAMPFSPIYKQLYETRIKLGVEKSGFKCVRADEIRHTRAIHDVIFELVRNSKLMVFLADGANPNAYYEAGFADAMRKEVVIVAETLNELRFDVSNRLTITYGDRPSTLPQSLKSVLSALRSQGTNM